MPAQPEIDIRQHSAQTRSRMARIGLVLIVVVWTMVAKPGL